MAVTFTEPSPPTTGLRGSGLAVAGQLRWLGRRTLYLLIGLPIGLVSFVAMVAGLALGLGTLVTLVGLPILAATLLVARGLAMGERALLRHLTDIEAPAPTYLRADSDGESGWWRTLTTPLRDRQSWFDVGHAVVTFPVSLAAWVITVVWWSVAVAATTWPAWGWLISDPGDDLPTLLGLGDNYATRAVFYLVSGVIAAASLPWVIAGLALARAKLAEALLVSPGRQRRQIEGLVAGRDAGRAAEETALRRLERDIHDGPQQRLIRLSMDLGRARSNADAASPELDRALDAAQQQAKETLDELRALSRGIAPPILVDRGLRTALEELAVRATVPTECDIELGDQRLDSYVESAVYFVASEAVANVAKHSDATQARIHVYRHDDHVWTIVTDNGIGGASVSKGHGLAGLDQRVRAVDGRLTIDSPAGGPTTIAAAIPCGS